MDITSDTHSQHISRQFNQELEELKTHLMAMGGLMPKAQQAAAITGKHLQGVEGAPDTVQALAAPMPGQCRIGSAVEQQLRQVPPHPPGVQAPLRDQLTPLRLVEIEQARVVRQQRAANAQPLPVPAVETERGVGIVHSDPPDYVMIFIQFKTVYH